MNRESHREENMAPSIPEPLLRERYGHTTKNSRNSRMLGLVGGIGFAVVVAAWLWWAGLSQPTAQFEARDLGWERIDDRTISVSFDVSVTPGTALTCALQALNAQYGIVGWVVVDLPESKQRTTVYNQVVRTSEPAVTGLLYRCWVP